MAAWLQIHIQNIIRTNFILIRLKKLPLSMNLSVGTMKTLSNDGVITDQDRTH